MKRSVQNNTAPLLGQEIWFHQLFTGVMDAAMLCRFERFNARSMLDIGSRYGTALLQCHYKLGVVHLEGVESESKTDIELCLSKEYTNIFTGRPIGSLEEYWGCMAVDAGMAKEPDETCGMQKMPSIQFETPAEYYTPGLTEYDIIVLSKVLHYQKRADHVQRVLDMVTQRAHQGTLIYLSVRDDFGEGYIDGATLLELCRQFATLHQLAEYMGPSEGTQGQSFIFTNI
jgi:hypothetical protein